MSRIAVLGAGAVGGMVGAFLARAGHEVTVLGSDRTAAAVAVHGLRVRSATYGEVGAPVVARTWLSAPTDLLVVGVKAPDLLPALTRVPAPLVAGATVVPLLNGVDHVPLLRALYPDATVVPMTVAVEAARVAPGVIEHLSPFARYASAGATAPGALLAQAGLDVDESAPDEATLLWRKLGFLAPFALLTTVTGASAGPARAARPDLVAALPAEAAAAAEVAGVTLDAAGLSAALAALPDGMRSSMLRDAQAGATLELDAIAGPLLRGAPDGAPVTRAVLAEILG